MDNLETHETLDRKHRTNTNPWANWGARGGYAVPVCYQAPPCYL